MKPSEKLDEIDSSLRGVGYVPDREILITLFLALELGKPILVEGPPGTGKTMLARKAAEALGREFFRIQCYEGITFEQIVGEWNYQKQLLSLERSRISGSPEDVFSEEYFIKRPLLSAFINEKPSLLLIDEIDKADEEVESFLLQALGEKQITVNDLGTFDLRNDILVFLTSNSQRNLLDETRDRCLYIHIDYPDPEREMEIVRAHVPSAPAALVQETVMFINRIRELGVIKKPSIRATVDWLRTLMALGKEHIDRETAEETLGVVIKNRADEGKVRGLVESLDES
ncbi:MULTISPECIES: MoxR family ATPase [Methanothermobacter]|uniref:Predicted ATPase n=1 Tax=Methanothermobacter marburgensis (strain ATCC BAA-927 / DSM 2133 / JCM 14651 / NBRC 100331 / OCM 82 / Marburg) TaxID=79929 RepID=D9PUT8_METTM|nr:MULTISPECIES: MoxR family ATPase [Methanothermobacter]ADL57985.1 predicted ATPase [Methanothermobacter marburgensis str. Marburg]QHN08429.1 MoxR family ATPase [Methanothermobacter sp. THM-2]WBF10180.1 MoxR family ATPase [Methanothermobacter marburgensis]